jgi:hypothetical protein
MVKIAIHITNEFRSNAVLGKVVVDANIKNAAEQVASILKADLTDTRKRNKLKDIVVHSI